MSRKQSAYFVIMGVHVLLAGGLCFAVTTFGSLCGWDDGAVTTSALRRISDCRANVQSVLLLGLGLLVASAIVYSIGQNKNSRVYYVFIINAAVEVILLLDKSLMARNEFFVFLVPVLAFLVFFHAFRVLRLVRPNVS